jgi:crotonobetainyl-CoA:carnitine CoA-transferase CaiB-like acyl-CoA transferase
MIQIRTFFGKKYDVYDAQTNSLHSAGVANSVQLQELREVANDGLISVQDRLEEQDNFVEEQVNFNNTILQMVKSNTMDDNATAFSAMTMNIAKDRRIEELEAQIRSQRLRSTPQGGNSVGGGSNSYGGSIYGQS